MKPPRLGRSSAVGQRRKRVKPWPRDGAASPQPTQGPHQAEGSSHSGLRWQRALNQSCVGMYYTLLCHIMPRVCDSLFFSVSPVFLVSGIGCHKVEQCQVIPCMYTTYFNDLEIWVIRLGNMRFQWYPMMKLYDLTPGTDLHKNIQDMSRIQKRPKFSIWRIHPFVQATSHHGRSGLLGDGEGDSLPQVLRRWANGWSTWWWAQPWWAQPQIWGVCYTKVWYSLAAQIELAFSHFLLLWSQRMSKSTWMNM